MSVLKLSRIAAFFAFLVFCGQTLLAQGVFGTLDGVVSDPTGAVVPNAKVILTDAGSGSARDTVSDSAGFYTFASVPVGTYNLAVSAGGFKDFRGIEYLRRVAASIAASMSSLRWLGRPDRLRQC